MAIPAKIRKLIEQRDECCWHCGTHVDLVVHHRKNRGMGGSKLLDTPDNLMLICALYNGAMEADAGVARSARQWGHKLPGWESTGNAVFQVGGGWWYLLPDGSKVRMPGDHIF